MVKVWIREERFEAALPLGSRTAPSKTLTPTTIRDVAKSLCVSDPDHVYYPSWVTEAWRHLQWGEPTASLFWEMLCLLPIRDNATLPHSPTENSMAVGHPPDSSSSSPKDMSNPEYVRTTDLILFLFLHLPDACSKVSSQPSNYDITWPERPAPDTLPTFGSPSQSSVSPFTSAQNGPSPPHLTLPPTHSFSTLSSASSTQVEPSRSVFGDRSERSSLAGSDPPILDRAERSSSTGSSTTFGGDRNLLGMIREASGGGLSTSPMSPRSSPRSFFQKQAWSKTEAHHVTFLKHHLRDLLSTLDFPATLSTSHLARNTSSPPESSSTSRDREKSSVQWQQDGNKVSSRTFDALGFLMAGGRNWESDTVGRLSELVPYWQNHGLHHPAPVSAIECWLDDVLSVNELLYPPATEPFGLPGGALESTGVGGAVKQNISRHDARRPLLITSLSQSTAVYHDDLLASPSPQDPPLTHKGLNGYIQACHESHLYLLTHFKWLCITSCTNSTIVVGAVSGLLRIMNCESVTIIGCARRLVICNCLDSTFYVFVTKTPVLAGDNRGCRLAPYNTNYRGLEHHLRAAGLPTSTSSAINHWNNPMDLSGAGLTLGVLQQSGDRNCPSLAPGPPLSPTRTPGSTEAQSPKESEVNTPAGAINMANTAVTDQESRLLPPENFYLIKVPDVTSSHEDTEEPQGQQRVPEVAFPVPTEYAAIVRERNAAVDRLQKQILSKLDPEQRASVEAMLTSKFHEWLAASGNLRQVLDLVQLDTQANHHEDEEEDAEGMQVDQEGSNGPSIFPFFLSPEDTPLAPTRRR